MSRGRLWDDHRAFWVVLFAFIVLASAYSVVTPLFEAPDEQWHFAFVRYVAQGRGLPVQKPGQLDHLARQEASQPPLYYLAAAGVTFWVDTSDFPGIAWENPHYGFDVPGVVNDNKNLFIHTAQEGFPWHNTALAVHLARFLSVLFGGLAVTFSYLLALEVFRGEETLATASAAFVSFVPQFLFVSGAVSNDSTIVAACSFALWLIVRMIRPDGRHTAAVRTGAKTADAGFWPSVLIGVAAGLAGLGKVSGLGVGVLGAFTIIFVHRKNVRGMALRLTLFASSFLLLAGWWYARNFLLYGEFTGTEMMLSIFGARVTPLTLSQFAAQLNEVWETFWIGFGWGNIRAPSFVYGILGLLIAIGVVGWVTPASPPLAKERRSEGLTFLFLWIALTLAAFLRWMLLTQAPHGRLLFPALGALAPLVVHGWTRLQSRVGAFAARVPSAILAAMGLYALIAILRPAYAFPPTLAESDVAKINKRLDIGYDGEMKLLGYDVSPVRAMPDSAMTVNLYWQALVPMQEDYSIGIALLDANRQVLTQRNSYPGHGMLPTRLMRAGQVIQDAYWLPIPANAPAPNIAQIQVSLFKRETRQALPAFDPQGKEITPIVGRVKIESRLPIEARPQYRTEYVFGDQIMLMGYDVARDEIALYWKRVTPIQNDFTVFAHWLDPNGNIVAQKDAEPGIPTSLWDDGEVIVERYARSSNRVRIGLYTGETGTRLAVGSGDSVILGPFEMGR